MSSQAYRNGWDRVFGPPPPPPPLTTRQRIQRFKDTTGAFSWGGKHAGLHPDACVCNVERDAYPGTPHTHYEEPPHACARCMCTAYRPMQPNAAAEPMKEKEKPMSQEGERDVYMVNVNKASGSVFVKELDFFRSQGGFKEDWGTHWHPIVAMGIEDARKRACAIFPGARPYDRQAKP